MSAPGKRYLGDGVYVELDQDRDMVKLTTSNGLRDTNTIYLEAPVLATFERWIAELRASRGAS